METTRFEELNIRPEILRAVEDMGFEEATPIQAQAIPVMMTGVDMIGQAQTGTGKTASFGIPLLEKVDPNNRKLQALVLCPTRELAIQVAEELRNLAKYMHGVKVLPIYGGQDIVKQIRSLKGGVQIIVGTPGRVMDHMRRHTIRLDEMKTIVLDEADEMLNMGFREDIETILKETPENRQTVLFSATMPQAIMEIARTYQKDATHVKVVKKELTVPSIEQYYYEVRPKNKDEVLCRLLDLYAPKLSLVFCNTKKKVDDLVLELQNRGYFAEGLHGDLKQIQRDRVMQGFRDGNTDILVATDVAARGIDVDDVEAVFNYDLPQDDEYYVHRIGRTGRAGRTGRSFTFIVGREVYKLKDIQRYCKTKIIAQPIPSLDDVANVKVENVFRRLERTLQEEDMTSSIRAIEEYLNESDHTAMDLAAAFLKLELGDSLEDQKDELAQEQYSWEAERREKKHKHGKGGSKEDMVRLFLNVGKKQKLKPGDILGAIAGESGMPGKAVGSIDMYDKYTFVDVPQKYYKQVMKSMKHTKIKGNRVNIEKASDK
jgi:ATP-dependent RNA helicase DeaD